MAAVRAQGGLRHLRLLRLPLVLETNGLGCSLGEHPVLLLRNLASVPGGDYLIE
jgi:hypothetical protein